MSTVTARPAYGTIDYYVELIRSNAERYLDSFTLYLIDDLANHPVHDDGQDGSRLDRIRNILAAAELVRAELREAAR
jgi:hypothetical protein